MLKNNFHNYCNRAPKEQQHHSSRLQSFIHIYYKGEFRFAEPTFSI